MRPIRSTAVLGAGAMGAQIAAHFANAGLPVLLLDVTPKAAADGRDRLRTLKPDPLFTPDTIGLIRTAGFEALNAAAAADWIVEAVVEDLSIKQELLAKLEPHLGAEHDRLVEHVRHPARVHRRGAKRRVQTALARHALLQPAALPAAGGSHSDE